MNNQKTIILYKKILQQKPNKTPITKKNDNIPYKLNFLACAIGTIYEDMLLPFVFFALLHNDNSHVEIIVRDKIKFTKTYKNEIDELISIFGKKKFLIRNLQKSINKNIYNTYRFFEIPVIKAEYTYIIDIDIMILESILPSYIRHWEKNMIYNNILRNPGKSVRLTGVHIVKTKEFYTEKYKQAINKYYNKNTCMNDEIILGNMCKECHRLPSFTHRYRPILGIHFSPNRGKNKKMNLVTNKKYYDKFIDIAKKYKKLFEFRIFKNLFVSINKNFIIR